VAEAAELLGMADCLLKIRPVSIEDAKSVPEGKALIGFPGAVAQSGIGQVLAGAASPASASTPSRASPARKAWTLFPAWRPSPATGGAAGGILHLPKFLPMLTTAAGTIRPAQALILGAGVAGLQAIATARRLGAVVEAFDVRPAVKEQVKVWARRSLKFRSGKSGGQRRLCQTSFGGNLGQQQKLLHERAKLADFIISTAQVPGKPAPRLITKEWSRT
jgi:H+-translocating NAD(P) transhydrogenase subunit alpha